MKTGQQDGGGGPLAFVCPRSSCPVVLQVTRKWAQCGFIFWLVFFCATTGTKVAPFVAGRAAITASSCSCDCCVSLSGSTATCGLVQMEGDLGSLVPRTCPLTTATCTNEHDREDDYARYCSSDCARMGTAHQCVALSSFTPIESTYTPGTSSSRAGDTASLLVRRKNFLTSSVGNTKAAASARSNDPPLPVVKAQMMQAYSSAQAAGQAALRARTAYERTLGNVKAQSEKLAQDMLASVKHEARLQATVALQKRNSWEAASLQAAHDAGAGVQAKYEADSKAAAKSSADLQARAQDYVNAAGQREAFVDAWKQRAELVESVGDHTAAQQSLLQLSQAEDQAAELQQRAAAIQREAAQAADAAAFYTTHAAAAAEYEFEQALPKGVGIPPPGNPLRFN